MSSSDSEVTFEVHILQNGRWEVHGSYPADKQGQAVKDAKALEALSTITGVKVVREQRDRRRRRQQHLRLKKPARRTAEGKTGGQEVKTGRWRQARESGKEKGEIQEQACQKAEGHESGAGNSGGY